jgi:hypothetical protein
VAPRVLCNEQSMKSGFLLLIRNPDKRNIVRIVS